MERQAEHVPQGTLAERIRAGGAGISAFLTPTGVGADLAAAKEQRVFNGRTYLLEEAITADLSSLPRWTPSVRSPTIVAGNGNRLPTSRILR